MDWYSGRPPRNGLPFDENVFHAFQAMMGVARGGGRPDKADAEIPYANKRTRNAIEATNVVN